MAKYRDLPAHEVELLQTWRARYGREWKSYLNAAWGSYSYKGLHMGGLDTGTLRNLRNDLGPSWLASYRLPHPNES